MLRKIHIIVALIAALSVAILSLYQDITFYEMCIRLVMIIPVFYALGLIFRHLMITIFDPPEVPEPDEEEGEDENLSDADDDEDADDEEDDFD